jgi:hypothetical protein
VVTGFACFGQGEILFNNREINVVPPVVSPIYLGLVGGALCNGTDTSLRAALLGGASTLTPAFIPGSRTNGPASGNPSAGNLDLLASANTGNTWVTFRTGSFAGFVAVGTDTGYDSGLAYGSVGLFQIVAWRGGFNTWISAYSAWASGTNSFAIVGASNPMILQVSATSTSLIPGLQGLESFSLQPPIPEPSSFALASLGALVWYLIRGRRKGLG